MRRREVGGSFFKYVRILELLLVEGVVGRRERFVKGW